MAKNSDKKALVGKDCNGRRVLVGVVVKLYRPVRWNNIGVTYGLGPHCIDLDLAAATPGAAPHVPVLSDAC